MSIYGVELKNLKTFDDDRGFFREIIRSTDPIFSTGAFGQWSHSKMTEGVVKAWHYHHIQTDWWYIAVGRVQTILFDYREESPTYGTKMEIPMGEIVSNDTSETRICLRIPPGVLHGCQVESPVAHLFYITSHTYNPNDEGRLPYNSEVVGQNWGPNPIVSDQDRKLFVPTTPRKSCLNQL